MAPLSTATVQISRAQAEAICAVLNDACMDVVMDPFASRPVFVGATAAQIMAAAMVVMQAGGPVTVGFPEAGDWLLLSFEADEAAPVAGSYGSFSSVELGWA